jgi:hypothetical protein
MSNYTHETVPTRFVEDKGVLRIPGHVNDRSGVM